MKAEHTNLVNKNRIKLQDVIPLKAPLTLFIDPCNGCNFSCNFCAIQTSDRNLKFKKQLMDFELFKSIIDNLKSNNIKLKMLRLACNGEPLLHPQFPEITKYAKQAEISDYIETVTNGSKLNPELNENLVNSGIDRIRISVEAIDKEGYERIAGVSIDFDKFRENILDLYKRSQGKCEVYIKIVDVAVETEEKQNLFYKLFQDRCNKIFIDSVVPVWSDFDEINQRFDMGKNSGVHGQQLKEVVVCPFPFYSCVINPDGDVTMCCSDWERKLVIGNLKKQSLLEIWNSEKMKNFWISLLEGNRFKIPPCDKCLYPNYNCTDYIDPYANEILKNFR